MNASKKNIQYPAQTGAYKVFVKDKGLWRTRTVARLQISVGNPKHTGDKFYALTEWAAARFDQVILIVSDTLQRHNVGSYEMSAQMGKNWLLENKAAIEAIPAGKRTVTLWDDWLAHPDYAATKSLIDTLYSRESAVRDAVREKAAEFCSRNGSPSENAAAFDSSVTYILEEVAAFAVMFRDAPAIDVYPGEWFKGIFDVIYSLSDDPLLAGFADAQCMRVDFTRNKAFA